MLPVVSLALHFLTFLEAVRSGVEGCVCAEGGRGDEGRALCDWLFK